MHVYIDRPLEMCAVEHYVLWTALDWFVS